MPSKTPEPAHLGAARAPEDRQAGWRDGPNLKPNDIAAQAARENWDGHGDEP